MKFQKKAAIACACIAIFIFGFLLGYLRAEYFLAARDEASLAPYIGKGIEIAGKVVGDPDRRDTSLRITVRAEKIHGVELPANQQGKFIAILPRDTNVAYGDMVEVKSDMELPDSFETDTGHIFDYPDYLRVQGISATMSFAVLEEKTPGGFSVVGSLFS
ncbi:MAG TPA: DUF4131 domain-containing protein, partial [Candidatus Paceibacterota bacterium]|nr:DUF4131 domain-containing protein [Candidatus Paceibacterota bacterium]